MLSAKWQQFCSGPSVLSRLLIDHPNGADNIVPVDCSLFTGTYMPVVTYSRNPL